MADSELRKDGPIHDQRDLAGLERQVERGSLFTHTIVSRNSVRIEETESFLYGVIDLLIEKGLITQNEVLESAKKISRQMQEQGETAGPGIALRIEGDAARERAFTPVNCSERLHICKAVCCHLHFALTAEEVEAGRIKWDLGQPYYIRHDAAGGCCHLEAASKACAIYGERPGVCRHYSCAGDERIWKDFEAMVLNEEWIHAHLQATSPRLVSLQMTPESVAPPRSKHDRS